MTVPIGTFIDNRYEVIAFLGKGTFGEVYEVRDHHQSQVVALKLLDPAKVGPWPWNEATQLTRLRSEFILPVWNAHVVAGVPYVVTELARGGTLADVISQGALTPEEAVNAIRQAARGASRTHDDGIVHRDIKLENLFVSPGARVRLGDFGRAHPLDGAGQAPAAGTPATQAPEVLAAGPASVSSDVYSLGACLYRLLTGISPYQDVPTPDLASFRAVVAARPPTPIRDLAPHITRGLASVVETSLARLPGDRHRSAGALDAALGALRTPSRRWHATTPHAGHDYCWATRDTSDRGIDVCVSARGVKFEILVTHSPSGRRIRNHCHQGVPRRALPGKLRRIFESLGN